MKNYFQSPRLLSLTIWTIIYFAKSLGLLPYFFNRKRITLNRYRFPFVYIVVYNFVFCSALFYGIGIVIPPTNKPYSSDAVKLALDIIYLFYFLTMVLTFMNHYSQLDEIEEIFADCMIIFKTFAHLKIETKSPAWHFIMLLVVHCLLMPFIQMAIVFSRLLYTDPDAKEHYFFIGMISFSSAITSIVSFLFYCVMLGACYLYRILNAEILKVMTATSQLKSNSSFRNQKQFCDLSDTLDNIADVHLRVTDVTHRISNLVAINLLLWIMSMASSALLVCLTSYIYCLDWAFVEGFKIPIQVFVCDILSLIFRLIEAYMFVHMCSTTMNEVMYIVGNS